MVSLAGEARSRCGGEPTPAAICHRSARTVKRCGGWDPLAIADCQSGDSSGDPAIRTLGIHQCRIAPECNIESIECHNAAISNRSMNAPIGNCQLATDPGPPVPVDTPPAAL
jgi:hypothetical protein